MKQILRNMSLVMVAMTLVFAGCEDDLDGLGNVNGHDYVDLGLPSGLKWATCNVGAATPEDYGDYYAWGETTTKTGYFQENSVTLGQEIGDISGNANYDAATANWGGSWRMPTRQEMEDLKYKCTWKWTTQRGVNGYKVTGPNGNSIFLPAAGYRRESSRSLGGESGIYWSSTPTSDTKKAFCLDFCSSWIDASCWKNRNRGHTVRPVSE